MEVGLLGVTRTAPDGRPILRSIDLEVPAGRWVAIVGPSGGGKTTLLSVLAGLDGRFEGEVRLFGASVGALSDDERTRLRRRRVGFVYQAFHLMESWTVAENVSVPLWLEGQEPGARLPALLERVGMKDRASSRVRALSGGERQRVAIARALVHEPGLLIADEPTGNLDKDTGRRVMDLVQELRSERPELRIVMATHEDAVSQRADEVWHLVDGRLERDDSC
jgi:putative ABC transport system ATP-binding protein